MPTDLIREREREREKVVHYTLYFTLSAKTLFALFAYIYLGKNCASPSVDSWRHQARPRMAYTML